MRRWHSREQYRARMLEIARRVGPFGFGADIIVGFPGETEAHHAETRALVEELPFTYLHVFPYSVRDGTPAASFDGRVPGNIQAERSRDLRDIAHAKGLAYRQARAGQWADIVAEQDHVGITEDYLRVRLTGDPSERSGEVLRAPLSWVDGELQAQV